MVGCGPYCSDCPLLAQVSALICTDLLRNMKAPSAAAQILIKF